MGCLKVLLRKEFTQFRRNKFIPRLIFAFPVIIMLIAPIVANMDVKGVSVAFVDHDRSPASARILSHLKASGYFRLRNEGTDYPAAFRLLEEGEADVIVSIPAGFEKGLYEGTIPDVAIDANAVNATKGTLGGQYAARTLVSALTEIAAENGIGSPGINAPSVRYFYNETRDYRHYMIPAFILILVMLVCCFIPALNLVMEKEKGTIEQINVTPVSPLEFTLGKLIPYWIIGLVVITEGILTVGLVYGLWPEGNAGIIYLGAALFALAMSGFSIAIANRSETLQQCIFVLFFFVMIFMLMSGILTPFRSMPRWAQLVTVVFPPRYFNDILRAVYLKGATFLDLGTDFIFLGLLAAIFSMIAALSYKKQE